MSTSGPKKFIGQVEVLTWGSKPDGGNGLLSRAKLFLFGGNMGHAALRITVPVKGNEQKIKEFCYDIPFTIKTLPSGEKVYEIVLSAWGLKGKVSFTKDTGITTDMAYGKSVVDSTFGRTARHFNWDPKWHKYLNPEKRLHRGLLGKSLMTYGPANVVHVKHPSKEKLKEIEKINEFMIFNRNKKSFNHLLSELLTLDSSEAKSFALSATQIELLDRYVPEWKNMIANPSRVSIEEINNLYARCQETYEQFIASSEINKYMEKMKLQKDNIRQELKKIYLEIESSNKITPQLQEEIQRAAAKYIDPFDWQEEELVLEKATQFDIEKINKLKAIFETEIRARRSEGTYPFHKEWIQEEEYDHYVTIGTPPDAVVILPIANPQFAGSNQGLDLEKMLQEAKRIAKSSIPFASPPRKFSEFFSALKVANCAKVANWILKAGSQNHQEIFEKEALGFIGTPQIVFNNAVRYQSAVRGNSYLVKKPKKTSFKNKNNKTESKEIKFTIIEVKNSDPHAALDEFAIKLKPGIVPVFEKETQKILAKAIKTDSDLRERYYDLCNEAIINVNKSSLEDFLNQPEVQLSSLNHINTPRNSWKKS